MGFPQPFSKADLELLTLKAQMEARESFWAYRQYLYPEMIKGWWQRQIAAHLMQFWADMLAGKRPMLLIMAPPQHGKSRQIVDFISWVSGVNPDLKTIYASFSDDLGTRANRDLQKIFDDGRFHGTFPDTRINSRNTVTVSGQALRNSSLIQFIGRSGQFMNTTVMGSITGQGMDLGVIDDPIKGRAEANSLTVRNRAWDWLNDDFLTRLSKDAGVLGIMTRWHIDDPFGRLIERDPRVKVLRYPALAEKEDEFRRQGEPLFPEHKPLDFLLERKATMAVASWEALYQQNPIIVGGGIFRDEWWKYYTAPPQIEWRSIYADTAQKAKESSDFSVFQCWGRSVSGQAVLIDQIRGKWEAPELLAQARAFWAKHKAIEGMGPLRAMRVEDKVSGTGLIQTLSREGIPVTGIGRSIDKVTRAYDAAPMVQSGNVLLPQDAPWLSDLLAEVSAFPSGANDDQVDPLMDAIVEISGVFREGYTLEEMRKAFA